jgi:superfamily I DNA/RNA helicase
MAEIRTVKQLAMELIRRHGEAVDRDQISDYIDDHQRSEQEHDALVDDIERAIACAKLTISWPRGWRP